MPDRSVPAIKIDLSTYGHITQGLRALDRILNSPTGVTPSLGDARMHLTDILLRLNLLEHPITRALPAQDEWWYTVDGAIANLGNGCAAPKAHLHRGRHCKLLAQVMDPEDAPALAAILNTPELDRYRRQLALVRVPRGLHREHLEAVQRDLTAEGLAFPETHRGWTAHSPEPPGWTSKTGAAWELIDPHGQVRLNGAGYPAIRLFLRAAPLALSSRSEVPSC